MFEDYRDHFVITMEGITCLLCDRKFKLPRMGALRSGKGNQGYGRRGSQRGATNSVMLRHLRAKHPETKPPKARFWD